MFFFHFTPICNIFCVVFITYDLQWFFISTVYATTISFHITISSEQNDNHNHKTVSATVSIPVAKEQRILHAILAFNWWIYDARDWTSRTASESSRLAKDRQHWRTWYYWSNFWQSAIRTETRKWRWEITLEYFGSMDRFLPKLAQT